MDLKDDSITGQFGGLQGDRNPGEEAVICHGLVCDVDEHTCLVPGFPAGIQHLDGLQDDPAIELFQQACLFRNRQELPGGQLVAFFVRYPEEYFIEFVVVTMQADDRLEQQFERVVLDAQFDQLDDLVVTGRAIIFR